MKYKNVLKLTVIIMLISAAALMFIALSQDNNSIEEEKVNTYLQVDAQKAKELMEKEDDYIILDVRTEEEYNEKHIPGAILIPDYEVYGRAEKELPDKDQMILVYCRSGNRSKSASQILAAMGYTNIIEFGGINSWPYETE